MSETVVVTKVDAALQADRDLSSYVNGLNGVMFCLVCAKKNRAQVKEKTCARYQSRAMTGPRPLHATGLDPVHLARCRQEFLPESRMGDVDQVQCPLLRGLPAKLGNPELGDHMVNIVLAGGNG